MTPIRPVSEDHRHEPADYELEPNELAACPTPWCNHSEPPYTWQGQDDLHTVICAECQVEGPYKHSEAEAIAAWNQRASLATRPCCAEERERCAKIIDDSAAMFRKLGQDARAHDLEFEAARIRNPATAIRSNSHDG